MAIGPDMGCAVPHSFPLFTSHPKTTGNITIHCKEENGNTGRVDFPSEIQLIIIMQFLTNVTSYALP